MDAHKALHPSYTTKKMPNVAATAVTYSVFPLRKFKTRQIFVLVSMDI